MNLSSTYNKKIKLYSAIFGVFLACGFFFFSGTKPASAAEEPKSCQCKVIAGREDGSDFFTEKSTAESERSCSNGCFHYGVNAYYNYDDKGWIQVNFDWSMPQSAGEVIAGVPSDQQKSETIAICKGNIFESALCTMLLGILKFFGWLLSVAAAIFAWTADANSLTAVINGPLIYKSWGYVRDLLNIAFIMMLLYTAFTIIFQVDKSNKKIILTVVLMALLVNFSFPVSRFIIDIGNSLMFTIFKNLLPTTDTIFSNFANSTALGKIIHPVGTATISQLVGSVVFVGILCITFLMMAMLFFLRIVALAIIIIFSPIGFVGVLFPSVSSKIDWWGNLFKYTFFGPIMAFMIFIATQIMDTAIKVQWDNSAFKNFGQDPNGGDFVSSMATFAIPVVVLWIGMGVAQKMGIEGAAVAQKWATAAFDKVSGVSWAKRQGKSFMAQRKARQDEKDKGNIGNRAGKLFNKTQDSAHGFFSVKDPVTGKPTRSIIPGAKKAWERAARMRQAESIKDVKDKSEDLKGAKIEDLSITVNNSFDAAGAVKSDITKDQAGSAQAFMNKQGDDRKTFVEEAITTFGGAPISNMMAGAPANIQQAAAVVAGTPLPTPPFPPAPAYQDALRQVTSYINRKSEEVVTQYTK